MVDRDAAVCPDVDEAPGAVLYPEERGGLRQGSHVEACDLGMRRPRQDAAGLQHPDRAGSSSRLGCDGHIGIGLGRKDVPLGYGILHGVRDLAAEVSGRSRECAHGTARGDTNVT